MIQHQQYALISRWILNVKPFSLFYHEYSFLLRFVCFFFMFSQETEGNDWPLITIWICCICSIACLIVCRRSTEVSLQFIHRFSLCFFFLQLLESHVSFSLIPAHTIFLYTSTHAHFYILVDSFLFCFFSSIWLRCPVKIAPKPKLREKGIQKPGRADKRLTGAAVLVNDDFEKYSHYAIKLQTFQNIIHYFSFTFSLWHECIVFISPSKEYGMTVFQWNWLSEGAYWKKTHNIDYSTFVFPLCVLTLLFLLILFFVRLYMICDMLQYDSLHSLNITNRMGCVSQIPYLYEFIFVLNLPNDE